MNRSLATLAVCLMLATPLAAQEGDTTDIKTAGTLSLTFGDKVIEMVTSSSVYDTVRVGSASISPVNPDDTSAGAKQMLSLMATETLDGGQMVNIVLEYSTLPGEDGAVVLAEYAADVSALPFWSAGATGRTPVTMTFESFEFDGHSGKMTGSFEGELCKTADWGATPDPADCTTISGRFDTELYLGL